MHNYWAFFGCDNLRRGRKERKAPRGSVQKGKGERLGSTGMDGFVD